MVDHILVIGFGGPMRPGQVWPFLKEVTRGVSIPQERLEQVVRHYEAVGGSSPYNVYTMRMVHRLRLRLRELGLNLPVFVGMRNWDPLLADVVRVLSKKGHRRGIGVILAPHRAEASYEKYLRSLEEAKVTIGADSIEYDFLDPWHAHPFFIEAQADRVRATLTPLSREARESSHLIFTAHSIPSAMAENSQYAQEFKHSSRLVAESLGRREWTIAYQSRSGSARQPWLEPDVTSVIRNLHKQGVRQVVLVPIGFLCDNVEVLFDLDIEARACTEEVEMGFSRVSTVMDHPRFVEMFAKLIVERIDADQPTIGKQR